MYRRRARVVLAALTLASLVLITVDFRSDGRSGEGLLGGLRGAATAVFAPLQEGLTAAVRPVGDALGSVGDLFRLRAENQRLRQRVDELSQRRESFANLRRENEQLRSLLDMRERIRLETIPARTTALAPPNYEWTISIDAGASDGVTRDMPVVNGDGLVGRVIQVTDDASRVLLAVDPQFAASARIASSGEVGPITGQGGGLLSFEPLDSEAAIEQGDTVVTSGYRNGVYPSGIPIGTVESPGEPSTRLQRTVGVRPFVDFTSLDHVLVIEHRPGEPLPPLEGFEDVPLDLPDAVGPTPGATGTPSPGATGTETPAP